MLRALWFVIRTGLLVAAAVWVADRPGAVDIHWLGYDIRTQVGIVLLAGLVVLIAALALYRVIAGFLNFPRSWRRYLVHKRQARGHRALTLGLTAVAAGDGKLANYHAYRARRFLPDDKGLSILLEAQAARLKNDDEAARRHFRRLMANEDTAFLGLRGLLLNALERDDLQEAAVLAKQALELHPAQPWVLRMAYDLSVRLGRWDEAHRLLKQAARHSAMEDGRITQDRIALLLQEAQDLAGAGRDGAALSKMKAAHAADHASVPAALALAQHYLNNKNTRAAADVIEKTWREQPHPDLVPLWHEAMPKKSAKDSAGRMAWYERLVALRPDSAESQLAAAGAAIENNLWGSARAYLESADSIRPGPRLYRLRARLAQALGRPEEASLMLRKAAEAPAEKVWTCKQTGRIYDRWSPVAAPHGGFNTIAWDYPQPEKTETAAADRSELLITAPAARA